MGWSTAAANAGREKVEHPERFCSVNKCLWRTLNNHTGEWKPCGKHPEADRIVRSPKSGQLVRVTVQGTLA